MALTRFPLQELPEQPVAFRPGQRRGLLTAVRNELVELLALSLPGSIVLAQPFLRAGETRPARQNGGEIGLLPFRMTRRLLEFSEPREEVLDEPLNAPVAIGAL